MENEKELYQPIETKNRIKAVPNKPAINDIDLDNTFVSNIIDGATNSTVDLASLNSFTSISQARDDTYNMIDIMSEDPQIATALDLYASEACEPNDQGRVIWADSEDERILALVESLLDEINADKNAYGWVHSLVKYGDLYLRLVRESEYNPDKKKEAKDNKLNEDIDSNLSYEARRVNEDLIAKVYDKNDKHAHYLEAQPNPAEMFDLRKFGKTCGYLKANIISKNVLDGQQDPGYLANMFKYRFNRNDINVYSAVDYVHAFLEDNMCRRVEEVTISNQGADAETEEEYTYTIKRGQSILYKVFRLWRELSLLENSVMLNRITKSSIVRAITVEVGPMEKSDVRNLMQRIKSMIEQKASISVGNTYEDYTNPGPIENTIYIPVHDGVGALSVTDIGGSVPEDQLIDVNYFKNKLSAGLGIPKQYLGDTEDSTGFNGGTSLSLVSSQFAKKIKKIQNAFIQAITDYINLILLEMGMPNYINRFALHMQAPATQEEKDRRENMTSSLSNVSTIMGMLSDIEDPKIKLRVLKSLLSDAVPNSDIAAGIQEAIDKLEEQPEEQPTDEFGDAGLGDLGGEEFEAPEDMELPSGEEASQPMSMEAPEESFYNGEGEEQLNEVLPSWDDLGMSYMDYKK